MLQTEFLFILLPEKILETFLLYTTKMDHPLPTYALSVLFNFYPNIHFELIYSDFS